jgi:hypothetical protein
MNAPAPALVPPAQRVCGWCRKEIAPGSRPATFGMCAKCFVRLESDPKRPTTKDGWAALGAASDAVLAEFADWQQDNTPTTRAKLGSAIREFCEYLGPVIGNEAAFRYQATWQAFEDAVDRDAQLTATMAAQPTIDAGDAALMRHLRRERDAAREAFEHLQTATQAALDEAKKGGA